MQIVHANFPRPAPAQRPAVNILETSPEQGYGIGTRVSCEATVDGVHRELVGSSGDEVGGIGMRVHEVVVPRLGPLSGCALASPEPTPAPQTRQR